MQLRKHVAFVLFIIIDNKTAFCFPFLGQDIGAL